MHGYLSLLLHAHLPFVRHPEHEQFLEESWLYEGMVETYLPLLRTLQGWHRDQLPARLTLTLSPTLCCMLRDPLLQTRFTRRLESQTALAASELRRTAPEERLHVLAKDYHTGYLDLANLWHGIRHDLVGAFATLQQQGQIEIITCAATHGYLPCLNHKGGYPQGITFFFYFYLLLGCCKK